MESTVIIALMITTILLSVLISVGLIYMMYGEQNHKIVCPRCRSDKMVYRYLDSGATFCMWCGKCIACGKDGVR